MIKLEIKVKIDTEKGYNPLENGRKKEGAKTVDFDLSRILFWFEHDISFLLLKSIQLRMPVKKRYGYGGLYVQNVVFIFGQSCRFYIETYKETI